MASEWRNDAGMREMKTLHLCIIPLGMTQEWPIFVIPTSFRHSRMRMNEMMLTTFHIGKFGVSSYAWNMNIIFTTINLQKYSAVLQTFQICNGYFCKFYCLTVAVLTWLMVSRTKKNQKVELVFPTHKIDDGAHIVVIGITSQMRTNPFLSVSNNPIQLLPPHLTYLFWAV